MSDSDLSYYNKIKNSSVIHLRVVSKFEFKTFKKEIIDILKIEENKHDILDYDKKLKSAIDNLSHAMDVWSKENKHLAKA
ncbi:hypothetical protein [Winogradskyella sp.]|uniref:hypothetical protein n=1 Tax=Winogradskyella sp. TaxID=1883156 RepID=UPI003AB266FC